MRKVERIKEMIRGRFVKPTFFDSNYQRRTYAEKKKAVNYLKSKGRNTQKCERVIENVENFLKNALVNVKTNYNTIRELQSLSAEQVNEMYQQFLKKCELVEKSLNAYLEEQLQILFGLIRDHNVDYRDAKNTDMSYLLTKDAPKYLEMEIEGYGKLLLLWHGATGGTHFLLTDYELTEEDKEDIEKCIFYPSKDIAAGEGEFFNFYTIPNKNYPEFIISESDIEKIRFDGVKKLYPKGEYYYYDFATSISPSRKVIRITTK